MKQQIASLFLTITLLLIGIGSLIISFPSTYTTAAPAAPMVFYDGALGGLPVTQDMEFFTNPGSSATQSFGGGATTLDTTIQIADAAGYRVPAASAPTLNRADGFKLNFSLQIESENHNANNDRSGVSVILLAQDMKGIEIEFWDNEVWAQEGGAEPALFTHDEGVDFNTTTDIIAYELEIVNDTYTLTAPAMTTLTGLVRDYTDWVPPFGVPDFYEEPNFVFLGDNTTSAESRIKLAYVAVTTETAVIPTNTPTSTPTNTATPTATYTATPPPPGSTATPTNTAAPVDGTATPTNTPAATPTPDHAVYLPLILDDQ